MRFRWLGEACVEIEDKQHLLIDPNYRVNPEPNVDLILVTHEHDDHFRAEAKTLGAPIWAPERAVKAFALDEGPEAVSVVEPGFEDKGIEVRENFCYGTRESVAYLVHTEVGRYLHLGDSFKSPDVVTEVVFVPIFADRHEEIMQAVQACRAKKAYPIHFDPEEKYDVAQDLVLKLRALGIEAEILEIGEWVEG